MNFSKIFRSKKHTKKGLIDLNGLYIIYFVIIIYIPRNGRVHYIYIYIYVLPDVNSTSKEIDLRFVPKL